jgi:TonB family protein
MMLKGTAMLALATILVGACGPGSSPEGAPAPAVRDTSRVFYDSVAAAQASVTRDLIVEERPVLLTSPAPSYPDELRQARVQGRVVLRCIIDREGRVEWSSIEVFFGVHMGFIDAAKQALRRARFRPGQVRGQPVRTLIHFPYDFKITGSRR